jgi:hypothetical protein
VREASPGRLTQCHVLSRATVYWKLDEASATRYDATGTNPLAATNSPGQVAGVVGSAVQLNGAHAAPFFHLCSGETNGFPCHVSQCKLI